MSAIARHDARLDAWAPLTGLPVVKVAQLDPAPAPVAHVFPDLVDTYSAGDTSLTLYAETLRMFSNPDLYDDWQVSAMLTTIARMAYSGHAGLLEDMSAAPFWDVALCAFLELPRFAHLRVFDCDTCQTGVICTGFDNWRNAPAHTCTR